MGIDRIHSTREKSFLEAISDTGLAIDLKAEQQQFAKLREGNPEIIKITDDLAAQLGFDTSLGLRFQKNNGDLYTHKDAVKPTNMLADIGGISGLDLSHALNYLGEYGVYVQPNKKIVAPLAQHLIAEATRRVLNHLLLGAINGIDEDEKNLVAAEGDGDNMQTKLISLRKGILEIELGNIPLGGMTATQNGNFVLSVNGFQDGQLTTISSIDPSGRPEIVNRRTDFRDRNAETALTCLFSPINGELSQTGFVQIRADELPNTSADQSHKVLLERARLGIQCLAIRIDEGALNYNPPIRDGVMISAIKSTLNKL